MSEPDAPSGDFPVVYSQQAMVGVSFYDFSLVFFQESYKGTNPVANVTMPPVAAKHLAGVLADYVSAYEKSYGEIPAPPDEAEDEDEAAPEEG